MLLAVKSFTFMRIETMLPKTLKSANAHLAMVWPTDTLSALILLCGLSCTLPLNSVQAQAPDSDRPAQAKRVLRVICFGAHPDDAEYKSGGSAALWAEAGHQVKLVSLTNGDIGHWAMAGGPLAKRRTAESAEVAKRLGVTSQVLDIHDGELEATMENRRTVTRLIRDWQADVVISHRPWDYHPDHRAVGELVQDSAYMVAVPFFCPDTPPLNSNPVFLYSSDGFQRPYPFKADIVVAIDKVFERKVDALLALESQTFEGGALGSQELMDAAPPASQPELRRTWLRERWDKRSRGEADKFRDALARWYGTEKAQKVQYAEAFEICEYGRQPNEAQIRELFPFLGQ
jgi:LmbE family N-acetylglucosaminyl deacetylase